jgi:hypothetical protein
MVFRKRSTTKKYLEIFFTKLKIGLKEIKEYPANNYAGFTSNFFVSISYILFYIIFADTIAGELLGWDRIDYIIMFILLMTHALFLRFFSLSYFIQLTLF